MGVKRDLPTQAELLRRFVYDPDSGSLTWRDVGGMSPQLYARLVGKEAGAKCYRRGGKPHRIWVEFDGVGYSAHSIAWVMMYGDGSLPTQIDHADGNPFNNRRPNLRAANHSDNMRNRSKPRNNTSGAIGVYFMRDGRLEPWKASIRFDRKLMHLGCFATKGLAAVARAKAALRYHGKFAKFT